MLSRLQTGTPVLVFVPASRGWVIKIANRRRKEREKRSAGATAAAAVVAPAEGDTAGGTSGREGTERDPAGGTGSGVRVTRRSRQPVEGMSLQLVAVHVSKTVFLCIIVATATEMPPLYLYTGVLKKKSTLL